MATITIKLVDPISGAVYDREIAAAIAGPFAVHRAVQVSPAGVLTFAQGSPAFCITHRKSGARLTGRRLLRRGDAARIARLLHVLADWNFTRPEDLAPDSKRVVARFLEANIWQLDYRNDRDVDYR